MMSLQALTNSSKVLCLLCAVQPQFCNQGPSEANPNVLFKENRKMTCEEIWP